MKLHVTGVEVIEVEDPKGVCDPLPKLDKLPQIKPGPGPFSGPRPLPATTTTWPRRNRAPAMWQTRLSGDPPGSDPTAPTGERWTRNMQLSAAREQLEAGELKIGESSGNNGTFCTN